MTTQIQKDLSPAKLKAIVADILQEATNQGASGAEVDLGASKGFSVSVRQGDVESIEYNQDKSIDITVYFGQRMGTVSLSDIRPEAVKSAIQAACNIAKFTDEDPYAGMAEKNRLAFDYPVLETAFPWSISVDEAIELAKECESKALAKDKRIIMAEAVAVGTGQGTAVYGNTNGFIGCYENTRHEMSCVLVAKKGDEMQRDYSYTVAVDPRSLESVSHLANEAVECTVRKLGARKLSTRKVPVIFSAEEARGFLGYFISAISGVSLYRKSSFLLDRINTQVFPDFIQIQEKPHLPRGIGTAPFDDNGLPTRPNVFIENGFLRSYVLGVYSARKLGLQPTGNAGGVHNLIISTGQDDLAKLLKKMDTGLLVTEMMGSGINLITGDYSRGATGFWVEKGEIQYPVEEITVAGNLEDMYRNLVSVGTDVDHRGNIITGSILLDKMVVAGH